MLTSDESKKTIEAVKQEIEMAKGTRIWSDYINALKLISQVVFSRSSGFILEFIQNAEDAGLGTDTTGVLDIRINKQRIKIEHNGRTFSKSDVRAICGISSSKKPENGTLGYLGIGFKSVFKVSDCPEIWSGGLQFKFDRNHPQWVDVAATPWHVLPIWIDESTEVVDPNKTTFVIPLRDSALYANLREEVGKLNSQLYLFLRWLKTIRIEDEVSGQTWTLENLGETKEGKDITVLRQDGDERRFLFFRRSLNSIPSEVKQDRLTQEYRCNVSHREITVAFALDKSDNLAPVMAGAMYGGVYSFLPLGEARSGAKFPIQADFLVQPGRDAINYEAKWNHWLVEQIAELCKEAVESFKKDAKWRFQFMPVFEFTKYPGLESYDKLFGPKLIEPVENFVKGGLNIVASDGSMTDQPHAIVLTETAQAAKDLVSMGILAENEIGPILGGEPGLKLVDTHVLESDSYPFKKVDRDDLLSDESFLKQKSKEPGAVDWFRNLYLWLDKHPTSWRSSKGKFHLKTYQFRRIVLTADGQLLEGRQVMLLDLIPSNALLHSMAGLLMSSKPLLHPDILSKAKDDADRKNLRGFLLGMTGVQLLDNKTVIKDVILPKILTSSPKLSPNELVELTQLCQQTAGSEVLSGELWVVTKAGEVRAAKETILSGQYLPEDDWETNQQYVPGINFVSTEYVSGVTSPEKLREWRQFLMGGKVKAAPESGVEVFAENYAKTRLSIDYLNLIQVDKLKHGYDLQAEKQTGEKAYIEVKGQSHDQEVELRGNELLAADMYKDAFCLCIVSSIPETPSLYLVQNPAAPGIGKKDKLTVPIEVWKAYKH